MAEGVQLKKKICLRRKEKPAEFTFTQYLKVKLLWQSSTDLDLCIFYTKKDGEAGGVFSSMFRQKKSDMGAQDKFPFMLHTGDKPEPAEGGESIEQINVFNLDEIDTANVVVLNYGKAIDGEEVNFAQILEELKFRVAKATISKLISMRQRWDMYIMYVLSRTKMVSMQ